MPGKAAPPPPIETPLVLQRLSCRGKTFLDHPVTVTAEDSSIDDYGYGQRPDREVVCSADDGAFPVVAHEGSDSDGSS